MIVNRQTLSLSELTYEEAVARAHALAPAIEKRAPAADAQRRQPMETIQEFIDAGLVRMLVPRCWGGYELSINALIDLAAEPVSPGRHNRIRIACAATVRLCVQAIERIYTNSGAGVWITHIVTGSRPAHRPASRQRRKTVHS